MAIPRLRQGVSGFFSRLPSDRDLILAEALSPEAQAAFRLLSTYDQRHLCTVYRTLRRTAPDDPDLLIAGLLHDLGKAAHSGRVRLVDRVAAVLLRRLLPRAYGRLTRYPASGWRLGLALTEHHPVLGADWARELGCSERVCWLIAHHADRPLPDDPALRLLNAADESA